MTFPLMISIGNLQINAHLIFEAIAYFVGFRLYLRHKKPKSHMDSTQWMWIATGAILGAAFGSKLLYWFENPMWIWENRADWQVWLAGKTIVGGLIGGWIGVEIAKSRLGITARTGDRFVFPLIVGMTIGRLGCFFAGLEDHTYGNPTTWWTGINFGDGILRHPTQLYEIFFLLFLIPCGFWLLKLQRAGQLFLAQGALFQLFFMSYFLFRFLIDFIKPVPHVYFGLNNIQIACLIAVSYIFFDIIRRGSIKLTRETGEKIARE